MEQEKSFSYTYSAAENQEVLDIRQKYLPREENKLDTLRALDAGVRKPAEIFAIAYGCISAVVMGAGMSLVMTDIGAVLGLADAMVPGIAIGVAGLGMALLTYPIYKRIVAGRREKYGPRILQLSQELIQEE